MEYLSPDDLKIAESNGISGAAAKQRMYQYGWSKRRAITETLKERPGLWKHYKDIAVVSDVSFYLRIKKGMTPEEAATTPVRKTKGGVVN